MDQAILDWIQANLASPFLDAVMPAITYLGELGLVWLAIGVCLLFSKRLRPYGLAVIVAVVFSGVLVNLGIKPFVDRPRPFEANPDVVLLVPPPHTSSFPSGHAASSFAAAAVICFMPVRWPWKALSLLLAALIAFSRLYLYVHYPSDVLAGILIGAACGLLVMLVARKTRLRRYFEQAPAPSRGSPPA